MASIHQHVELESVINGVVPLPRNSGLNESSWESPTRRVFIMVMSITGKGGYPKF